MTDREMLEMAARAAGKTIDQETFGEYQDAHGGMVVADGEHWNPLIDEGDALRLAVHLGILLRTDFISLLGGLLASGMDHCDATRLAIVRIAAEIGFLKDDARRAGEGEHQ